MFTANVEQLGTMYAKSTRDATPACTFFEQTSVETAGDRLREFAKEVFGSQTALADAIDMGRSRISDYTSGRRVPGGDVLAKLAAAGLNVNWLLTGEGGMLATGFVHPKDVGDMGEIIGQISGTYRRGKDGKITIEFDPDDLARIDSEKSIESEEKKDTPNPD